MEHNKLHECIAGASTTHFYKAVPLGTRLFFHTDTTLPKRLVDCR